DVGAISSVSLSGVIRHLSARLLQTSSGGTLRVSSTPTQTGGCSQLPMSLKISSRQAAARMGPEPMAKNFSPFTSQPAYCDAIQAAIGSLVATETSCEVAASRAAAMK